MNKSYFIIKNHFLVDRVSSHTFHPLNKEKSERARGIRGRWEASEQMMMT